MSNEPTIEQMNEVIALFMGGLSIKEHGGKRYVYYPKSCAKDVAELKYHSNWDSLMPVVEKCRIVSREKQHEFRENSSSIQDPLSWKSWSYRYIDLSTNISEVYNRVYQFIQWFNKQQSNEQA